MSIALNQKVIALERRVEALEMALQVLIRSHDSPRQDVDSLLAGASIIDKLKNEIQGIKMRMGKQ